MAFLTPSLLLTIVFSLSQVWGIHPNTLIPITNATCQAEYAWMDNAEQQSPCLTVAYVIAACVGDTWTQPALPSGYKYNSPNGTTATPCYCSWSCYNLMMACTLCQDPAYTSDITTWASFSQNCSSSYKDQMFPQGYVLANNVSIPYWATINPTNWSSELFNIGEAQDYANQSHPDYYPSDSSPNSGSGSGSSGSSSDVGAVVGGSVGGAVGLLIIVIGGYFLYRHMRYRRLHNANDAALISHKDTRMPTTMHARWPSDPSMAFSSAPMVSPPPMSYTTTQSHGMGMGMSVLSPTLYSSFQAASPPPTDTASFLTTPNTAIRRNPAVPMV